LRTFNSTLLYIFALIIYLLRNQNAKLIVVDRLPTYTYTLHEFCLYCYVFRSHAL